MLDVPETLAALRRSGFAIAPACVPADLLGRLRTELDAAIATLAPYDYPFGEQRRLAASELTDDHRATFSATAALMLGGPVAEVCRRYGANGRDDLLVWSREHVRDTGAIYGQPHFDRRHQLKAFLYLDDVGKENGPTHVADELPSFFHGRWLDAWRTVLVLGAASDAEVLEHARATSEDSPAYRSVACNVALPHGSFTPLTGKVGDCRPVRHVASALRRPCADGEHAADGAPALSPGLTASQRDASAELSPLLRATPLLFHRIGDALRHLRRQDTERDRLLGGGRVDSHPHAAPRGDRCDPRANDVDVGDLERRVPVAAYGTAPGRDQEKRAARGCMTSERHLVLRSEQERALLRSEAHCDGEDLRCRALESVELCSGRPSNVVGF